MTATLAAGGAPVWVLQIVAFAAVFWLVWTFVIKRVSAGMKSREEGIAKKFSEIEGQQAEEGKRVAEYSRRLEQIEQEASVRMKQAAEEGLRLKAEIEAEAKQRSEDEAARTEGLIQLESEQAVVTLRKEAARLALEQAERMMRQAMTPDLQARLVDRYLREMEQIKQV
jgi:F-type H+-transporting ATPase subunit b